MRQAVQPSQPVISQTSQLRSKFSQLTDLLQNTALQRGISLSEVAVPASRKPGKDQPKRVSLEDVRTNFRSFTTASTSGTSGSKSPPVRRVSTGAITPAFLKQKNRQDKALLQSLGVADASTDVEEPVWQPSQSSAVSKPSVVTIPSSSNSSQVSVGNSIGTASWAAATQTTATSSKKSSSNAVSPSDIMLQPSGAERGNRSVSEASGSSRESGQVGTGTTWSSAATTSGAAAHGWPFDSSNAITTAHTQIQHGTVGNAVNSTLMAHGEAESGVGSRVNPPARGATISNHERSDHEVDTHADRIKTSGVNVNITLAQADGEVTKTGTSASGNKSALSQSVPLKTSVKITNPGSLPTSKQRKGVWQRLFCCGCCTKE